MGRRVVHSCRIGIYVDWLPRAHGLRQLPAEHRLPDVRVALIFMLSGFGLWYGLRGLRRDATRRLAIAGLVFNAVLA